jgi:hypothetical protein
LFPICTGRFISKKVRPHVKRWVLLSGLCIFLVCTKAHAISASDSDAGSAAQGWLRISPSPLGAALNATIDSVKTVLDENKVPLYYVISLIPEGYVICSADTEIEPILAFSPTGHYEPDPENPLYVLIESDIRARAQRVQAQSAALAAPLQPAAPAAPAKSAAPAAPAKSAAAGKWDALRAVAVPAAIDGQGSSSDPRAEDEEVLAASSGEASINDPRVDPFIRSRWNQSTVNGSACYNYYTPNNYLCGCVATAYAQILRYFQYPTRSVGTNSFPIKVDGSTVSRSLRGGDGAGGAYRWDLMPLDPASGVSEQQRQAIGALCADIGVAKGMSYTASGSSTGIRGDVFKSTFFYGNVTWVSGSSTFLHGARPNLDARLPVVLSISGNGYSHAVLSDGYGFNLGSTYYHLNMGWGGSKDAWYNIPDVDTDTYHFNTLNEYSCNIYTNGTGEILSGRVLDAAGNPVAGASVTATGGGQTGSAVSDSRGVYALTRLRSGTSFTITAQKNGAQFGPQRISTGTSTTSGTGNSWGNDLRPYEGGFIYRVNEDNTVTITGYAGSDSTVTIPAQIAGRSVVAIGDNAFQRISQLTSVVIPDGVKTIGNTAFESCEKLDRVEIGSGITSIGSDAFKYCHGLDIYFKGNAPAVVGSHAFYAQYVTIYYPYGATGWDSPIDDRTTMKALCTVTVQQGANGTVSPDGAFTVVQGEYAELTATPDPGFRVKHWLLNAGPAAAGQKNTSFLINANSTVSAVFEKIKAMPWLSLLLDDDIVQTSVPAAPQFDPAGGRFATGVSVTVLCETADAVIHYTTDGNDPTESSPTVTSGGTVSAKVPGTLKAKAWKNGAASPVQSALYERATPPPSGY